MNYQIGDPDVESERRHEGQRYQFPSVPRTPLKIQQHQNVKKWNTLQTSWTEQKITPKEFYLGLQPYILSCEELKRNGFPLDTSQNPGRVCFRGTSANPRCQRTCSRCREDYIVTNKLSYSARCSCIYHPGKRLKGAEVYSCCNRSSVGCITNFYHVSSPLPVGEVEFVKTRFRPLSQYSAPYKVYSLDTELCYTLEALEVTKVTVVDLEGTVVYDTHVRPKNLVIDYNTKYSGVTKDDLENITVELEDVQAFLLDLIHAGTILIGHGLENDLRALRLIHKTVVDTSLVFPNQSFPTRKLPLKSLAATYLRKFIQTSDAGHDSAEDARTCIELMLWKIQSDKRNKWSPRLSYNSNCYKYNKQFFSYSKSLYL